MTTQGQHSFGSPRVMAEPPLSDADRLERLAFTFDREGLVEDGAWLRAYGHGAVEAAQDRDAAQRLVEALWPANLLEARTVDGFPVIAAIVHELGRPLGEWSVQVERQSMETDDGAVDVELVSLHRITGRTS